MTGIPNNAVRVVLAAVVPCAWLDADVPACENNKHGKCAHYEADVCNGDGTRTVITDTEVVAALGKIVGVAVLGRFPSPIGVGAPHPAVVGRVADAPLWREVNEHG